MMPLKGEKLVCQSVSLDVLTSLPENVIDDILMHLPLREAVRTSILSKKWRYKWCRLPELTLDQTLWREDKFYQKINFTEIVCHILTLHAEPITKLTISIASFGNCRDIVNMICFYSRNVIQDLVLRLSMGYRYELPSSFLQLRHFSLENCSVHPPPSFKGFDRLTSFELRTVTISSEFLESLISHCSLLEQLVLHDILSDTRVIEINAPTLRSFEFSGRIRTIRVENIPQLATLSLADTDFFYLAATGEYDIAKIFKSFPALEHLHLNDTFFVAEASKVATRLPFVLNSVKHLHISRIFLGYLDEVSHALCFIRSLPYLQYLEIKVSHIDKKIHALDSLEVERLSDMTIFNHLREVKLEGIIGAKPELQFMKLMLAKSPVLARMLIESRVVEESAMVKILAELNNFELHHLKRKLSITWISLYITVQFVLVVFVQTLFFCFGMLKCI